MSRDFPGGPMCHGPIYLPMQGGGGSLSGQRAKVPQISLPKNQNINNRSNIITNSIKT